MKTRKTRKASGFVSTSVVMSIAFIMLAGITYAYRAHVRSFEIEAKAQVKLDYSQKEEAVLRSLLSIVPNKAIGAMRRGSSSTAEIFTWETIFEEAIAKANAESAIEAEIAETFEREGLISANTGDSAIDSAGDIFSAVEGHRGLVNPGNDAEHGLLFDPKVGDKLPAPLHSTGGTFLLDREYPIVSNEKYYIPAWSKGLGVPASTHSRFNLLRYPNIRFGYAKPGDWFVGKRNWWAFSITFGAHNTEETGIPARRKNYLLSIYEVPSQLPMSSAGFLSMGQHEDGTAWRDTSFLGGVFAGRLETRGDVALTGGVFAARNSATFSNSTTVEGRAVGNDFDALGVREAREARLGDVFDASVGGDVGRVVFVPLNRGAEFFEFMGQSDGPDSERLSPTGWNAYSTGARQAQMRIRITRMASAGYQMPIQIRFYYRNRSGQLVYRTYTRGANWPTESESGGPEYPFQTDNLDLGKRALVLRLDRLPAFLDSLGDADDVTVNNSLVIYPDSNRSTVIAPSFPSADVDPVVVLRGGNDMSEYTNGFSFVTNLRTYIAESLNTVPIPTPSNSGYPAGQEFFPPVSLFAPEKRFGISLDQNSPVEFSGQLNSLKTDETDAFRPLDLQGADNGLVDPDLIHADLRHMRSPAELPPIFLMNWLVTIEEIHDRPSPAGSNAPGNGSGGGTTGP
ncbi:MAG: hypothetical protein KDM91_05535 [Verrucomicrobiae bacterium]|nr:hypothetical protein [Verrucomicrobiae bacterium]MCP5540524.1 hypothetical protein [Akkermansiaceae bacterium]MCP5550788.1 hypothetical protein [Akkermansiaceae bacterium]